MHPIHTVLLSLMNEGKARYFELYASFFKCLVDRITAASIPVSVMCLGNGRMLSLIFPRMLCPFRRWGNWGPVACHRAARSPSQDSCSGISGFSSWAFPIIPSCHPVCKNTYSYPRPPSPELPSGLRRCDSDSRSVSRSLSQPPVNAGMGGFLKGELQGSRADSSLALQENWPDLGRCQSRLSFLNT